MGHIHDEPLGYTNVKDIVCCPGGPEIWRKDFGGDLERTVSWRKQMLGSGMKGFGIACRGRTKKCAYPKPAPEEF